jgi:putative transposase
MCTFDRTRVFLDAAPVSLVLSQFRTAARRFQFAVFAYCFMPDHLHLVVVGLAIDSDLQRFVSTAKQFAGFVFSKHYGARLWQVGYHDRIIRPEENIADVIRYVLENPVRAGLVDRIEDYPYAGSDMCDWRELPADMASNRQA